MRAPYYQDDLVTLAKRLSSQTMALDFGDAS